MDHSLLSPQVFTVLSIGVGGTVLAALGIFSQIRTAWRPLVKAYLPLAALLFALAAAAAALGQPASVWAPLALMGASSGLIGAAASASVRQVSFAMARRVSHPLALCLAVLVVSPAFAIYWPQVMEEQSSPLLDAENFLADAAPILEENPIGVATDAGKPVPLFYDQQVTPAPEVLKKEELLLHSEKLVNQMIRTAGPDATYNCHGWVFTGGLSWVKGEEVDGILTDNGYQPIAQPHAGDVAVYRDEAGTVVHTGIVRATGEKGFVLVESKWGRMGRYIHAPDVQLYASSYTYYRSPRPGHLLRGLSANQVELKDIDVSEAL